ncbi:PREDICTED: death-associated protein kinase 1-like [Branchiostoma belcheri]|uniref:non-specific serine/threonine protein kinase n=1 Tax=Branchiostoma belcheri TaxID=7741 RepID=A0A6P5AGV9_BRABE|nr:PREDICTED: death-associated protein kinase 1-like [Branchiostoma belcheri]
MASCEGNTGVAELLIEHGADVEAKRSNGCTALHLASFTGKTGVAELLIEHGADVEAKHSDGGTALHVASLNENTGVAELLIKHGADVKTRDNYGRTALHMASCEGNTGVAELLIEHGADVEAKHSDGQTALYVASEHGNMGVVELLIKHGADVKTRDNLGRKPLDYVHDQNRRRSLKNLATDVSYHKLMKQSGGEKLDSFKLCLCGPQEAGKSTLMESLQTGFFFALVRDRRTPDNQPHEPTPGVNVGTTNIPGVGQVSVWDFAGQSEYAVTHSMFMDAENTIFIVLYNIMDETSKQKREVHWWLCFIKSCNTKRKPHVILVASRADQTDKGHQQASAILELMTSEFKDHMNISDEVFLLDCRKTRQTDMRRLKDLLTRLKTQLLAHQRAIPKLCAEIMKCLPKWAKEKCSPKCPVLKWPEYKEAAKEIDRLIDEDFLKTYSQYLDHLGEILFVSPPNADPIIVLKPNWLCTDVFGKVMAPENFPIQRLTTIYDVVTKEEIQRVFQDVANVDLLITLLQEFQLCHTYDGQEFIIPGLLTQTMPPEKWQPTANPAKTVYFGKQVQCADTTDMFSSAFFPRVQTRLMRELKNRPLLWRDGAKCFDTNVESLIKLSPGGRAVNMCVRSEQDDKPSCRQMLEKIESILTNVLDECSPGTNTEERVLSARALREHREETYSYSMDQINKAKAEDGIVHHDILGFSENIDDLLYGGRDDDEEQQGAVGNSVQQTFEFVSGTGNVVIRAGDHAHFDMARIMQGNLGQLQLEETVPGDMGQLQLGETVPGDPGQLQLGENVPGDMGQLQLGETVPGDPGQLQLGENVPGDMGQLQLGEETVPGDMGQLQLRENVPGDMGQLQLGENVPGDPGQLQLEETVPGDLGQLQLEETVPGDPGQLQLEETVPGDLGQLQLEENAPSDLEQLQ